MPDPSTAIFVRPDSGEDVLYWTKVKRATLTFNESQSITRGGYTYTRTTSFSGESVTQKANGPAYLGPMMGARWTAHIVGTGSRDETNIYLDASNVDLSTPLTEADASIVRQDSHGIASPWHISVVLENAPLLSLPWSDFDRGGAWTHSWSIPSSEGISSGSFTLTLAT